MTDMSHTKTENKNKIPTKIVTIKGVDRNLYSQFSDLANLMTASLGIVFSHLIGHYLRNIKPLIPITSKRRLVDPRHSNNYEIIEDQKSVNVKKEDFEGLDLDIQFIFKNISELNFDETIDTKTFVKYVHSIHNSKVTVKGEISQLILLSINKSNIKELEISTETKDITIRNVDTWIYEEFTAFCHKDQMTIGDGVNKMLSVMVPHLELVGIMNKITQPVTSHPIIISMMDKLTISSVEMDKLGDNKLILHRIDEIKFGEDITTEQFISTVLGIYNCGDVKFPNNFPKLLKLSKQKNYP